MRRADPLRSCPPPTQIRARKRGDRHVTERPLWTPSEARIGATNMRRFVDLVAQRYGANATDYETLWSWSIANSEKFWTAVWDF